MCLPLFYHFTPETRIKFNVSSENEIKVVECTNPLISAKVVPEAGEHNALELTAKNEKTVVSIAKRNDIENNTKTSNQKSLDGEPLSGATLEIYEGIGATGTVLVTLTGNNEYTLDPGTLKENTIYTLHESQAPVGYLPAKDIYFKLFGTTTKDSKVVSQLYVWTGSETPSLNGSNWAKSSSIKDTILTMVDEAIIAPVDLQKVVGEGESYSALIGAEFEVKSLDGNIVLGTAVSDSNGHLVWKTVTNPNGMIFNADRKRITADTVSTVNGKTIILQQNQSGYHFKEIYAPDHAYNKGESFTVKITAKNYTDYRDGNYQTNVYVDILAANSANGNTVSELTARENTPASTDLVNPPFEAAFELYKYDAEHPAMNEQHNNYNEIGLKDVQFTLYKKQANGSYLTMPTDTACKTGNRGLLHINLTEKGTYKLVETTPLTGYKQNNTELEFTIINTDYKKTVTYSDTEENHTITVKDENGNPITDTAVYDLPNERNQVTFYKTDNAGSKGLEGAVFEVHEGDTCSGTCQAIPFYLSASATTTVYSVVSGSDGKVTIYGLPTDTGSDNPKTYHLVETTAPKGYKIASPVKFTIDRSGKVQVNTSDVTEVQMKDEPIKLYIKKTGEDSSVMLPGAQFLLTDICKGNCDHTLANGKVSETVTTETGGEIMIPIERVIAGHTYMLEETKAPDGYECTAKITFSVNPDGTANLLSTEGGYTDAVLDQTNKTTFTISNEKIRLSLVKVDLDYDDPSIKLANVKFTLKPADEHSSFIDSFVSADSSVVAEKNSEGRITQVTLTTDANGKIFIPLELVKHDNSYILTESDLGTGHDHYRLPEREENRQITFLVNKDGTIKITSPNDMFRLSDGDSTALVVTNQQITMIVSKLDQVTGRRLGNVTLRLTKKDSGGNWIPVVLSSITDADGKWTTNASTAATFKGDSFTPGTYKLEEISTPEGYNSIAGPLTFTIDQSGKVSKTAIGNESLSNVTDSSWTAKNFSITNPADGKPGKITLTVSNAAYSDLKIEKIEKRGSDTVHLSGVEFRLDYWDGTQWQYVKLDDSGKAIVTDHTLTPGEAENAKRITAADGIVTFSGLPNGKYRLTELKTAQGYNLLSGPLEIEIDRNGENYKVSYHGGTESSLTRVENTISLTVMNKKGFVLPATGTTTPQLPKAVLGWIALIEGLVLYQYQSRGKRRKRKG